MRKIKYISQILLFWLLVIPTLSQATVSDPSFTECGLFPSALNTWDVIDQGNGDSVINADTIYADNTVGGKAIQCKADIDDKKGVDCVVEELTTPQPTLPDFINSTKSTSHTASNTETDEEYGYLTVPSDQTVIFKPSGDYDDSGNPVMLIKKLTVEDGATLILSAGDYWIGSWDSDAAINIRTLGKVRLFIGNNMNLEGNHLDINYDDGAGIASNLFVFIYGDFIFASQGGGDIQNMTAYVYVEGKFTANQNTSNNIFTGAVTSVGKISVNNNQNYVYDTTGLTSGWGACSNADDLCYSSPIYEGTCSSFGDFKGGVGCTETILIKNITTEKLEDSIVFLDKTGVPFSPKFYSECGINEVSGRCGPLPLSPYVSGIGTNIFFQTKILDSYDKQRIYTTSTINEPMFTGDNLYGIYTKNGEEIIGKITNKCELMVEFELSGYEISEDIDGGSDTKEVHPIIVLTQPYTEDVTVTYYTSDGTARVADGDYQAVPKTTITIPKGKIAIPLDIIIKNDAPIELQEYFFVHIENPNPSEMKLGLSTTKITIIEQDDVAVCFEDNFNDDLNDDWRVLKAAGGFIPHIVDVNGNKRFRLTDKKHDLATAVTRDMEFPSAENLIIVEFDYYAYGGCSEGTNDGDYGADGIANILFDSNVGDSPMPGGSGGSLGYAQYEIDAGTYNGFEGGWLGLGLDEYGNYGNCNEGRIGGLGLSCADNTPISKISQHTNTAIIRGDGDGMNGYEFLNGVQLMANNDSSKDIKDYDGTTQPSIAKKSATADGYFSGRYKLKVDSRDPLHLFINLQRSTDGNTDHYHTIISNFDAKDGTYNQGPTPDMVRYAISAATGTGCNNHEIDNIIVRGRCSTFIPNNVPTVGAFGTADVWRTSSALGYKDQVISTKLVNEAFKLDIMSINDDQTDLIERPEVEVHWSLKYMNDDGQANVYKEYEGDWNVSEIKILDNKEFEVTEAYKDMYLEIKYCTEINATNKRINLYTLDDCIGTEELLEGDKSPGKHYTLHKGDHFSVRPSYLELDKVNISDLPSGAEHNVSLEALDTDTKRTLNYNTGISSLVLDHKKLLSGGGEDTNELLFGTLEFYNTTMAKMKDGISIVGSNTSPNDVLGISFDDVGKVEFGVIDKYWAAVDKNDSTPQECMTKSDQESIQSKFDEDSGIVKPFSAWICTESNASLTFIPDHFEITGASITNHRGGEAGFTYLSSDGSDDDGDGVDDNFSMAAHLGLSISAKNEAGETTKNFDKADDFYDKEVSVTFTVATEHPNDNEIRKVDLPDEEILDFVAGEYSIGADENRLLLNYERFNNQEVIPFVVDGGEVVFEVKATYGADSVTGESNASGKAHFYYAKTRPSSYFYEDVVEDNIFTPIMIAVYCDPLKDADNCTGRNIIDTVLGSTDERNWYISQTHNATLGDGVVTIQKHSTSEGNPLMMMNGAKNPTAKIEIATDGIDQTIGVFSNNPNTLPMVAVIELADESFGVMDEWLLYNPTHISEKPDPFYKVRFIGDSAWTGIGAEGNVINRDASSYKSKRMDW